MDNFEDIEKQLRDINFSQFSKQKDSLRQRLLKKKEQAQHQQASLQSIAHQPIAHQPDGERLSDEDLDYISAAGQEGAPLDKFRNR